MKSLSARFDPTKSKEIGSCKPLGHVGTSVSFPTCYIPLGVFNVGEFSYYTEAITLSDVLNSSNSTKYLPRVNSKVLFILSGNFD